MLARCRGKRRIVPIGVGTEEPLGLTLRALRAISRGRAVDATMVTQSPCGEVSEVSVWEFFKKIFQVGTRVQTIFPGGFDDTVSDCTCPSSTRRTGKQPLNFIVIAKKIFDNKIEHYSTN